MALFVPIAAIPMSRMSRPSGATAIVSGIESGSSDLWNSGLEELQEGSAQETELTKLALANLEKTAVLLTKCDAVDDILKEWNPAS